VNYSPNDPFAAEILNGILLPLAFNPALTGQAVVAPALRQSGPVGGLRSDITVKRDRIAVLDGLRRTPRTWATPEGTHPNIGNAIRDICIFNVRVSMAKQ
jgi:hypothetical protein